MALRVSETTYFVQEIEKAIGFYTDAMGFRLADQFEWGFAYLDVDGKSRIGLMTRESWTEDFERDKDGFCPRLALQSNSFKKDLDRMKKGGAKMGPIQGDEGKTQGCMVWDPDGNPIFVWTDPQDKF
jgi:catechol 2,3-dioxygenase-like lactoylglutathione lyase family enzyme